MPSHRQRPSEDSTASTLITAFSSRYGLAVLLLVIFAGTLYFGFEGAAGTEAHRKRFERRIPQQPTLFK